MFGEHEAIWRASGWGGGTSLHAKNANGMTADITNYGIVTRLLVPDRLGRLEDVVLGYDNLESYG